MPEGKHSNYAENLKEKLIHGDILFNLAVYFTRHRIAYDIMLYSHWHEELELLYILEGSMLMQIDEHSFVAEKGDIILIPPGRIHGAFRNNESPCVFYAIVFHPSFISSSLNDIIQQDFIEPFFISTNRKYYRINKDSAGYDEILNSTTDIIDLYNKKRFGYEIFIKSHIFRILSILVKYHTSQAIEEKTNNSLAADRMKKTLGFMEQNYRQKFSLTCWAASVNLSREQFCRFFKKHFNKTPIEYLTYYKIRKAADLLINTGLPIIDIALETGFESANYFTIVFKRLTGKTPSDFRKSYMQNLHTKPKLPQANS